MRPVRRRRGAALRIRNGGHCYGGWSSGPGLVVNLAKLNTVRVNAGGTTATIGAGALLADVYSQLGAKGVSIGGGSCATVGVTGLTLGGGVGVLARTYGLTCDQLKSVQVVTADGRVRTVSADTDADLFWALRGGGGSFAAVTELTFAVRPAPPVQTFFLQWGLSSAAAVLAAWQEWMPKAPRAVEHLQAAGRARPWRTRAGGRHLDRFGLAGRADQRSAGADAGAGAALHRWRQLRGHHAR